VNFDPKKPVQTRDGRPVRIVCTDFDSSDGRNILALIKEPLGESIRVYDPCGMSRSRSGDDLVNIKVKKWYWLIADYGSGWMCKSYVPMTEQEARSYYSHKHIVGRLLESEIEE
jgi:hypothetical protein